MEQALAVACSRTTAVVLERRSLRDPKAIENKSALKRNAAADEG